MTSTGSWPAAPAKLKAISIWLWIKFNSVALTKACNM